MRAKFKSNIVIQGLSVLYNKATALLNLVIQKLIASEVPHDCLYNSVSWNTG